MYRLLFFLALSINLASQKSTTIRIVSANSLSFDNERGGAQVLQGNVVCEHEGTLLHCDTALIYQKEKRMVASGNILITKGDSLRVTGDQLVYEGRTRMAKLNNNVRCVDKDMTLTTQVLTFDVRNSIANYYNGGTIVNKENTLVSKNGHYYSARREAAFHYSVVLTNPDYKMFSDTLRYHFPTKTAYFVGPSIIRSDSDEIYCENGWYDTERELSQFSRNAILRTKQQTLKGDSLTYDRKEGIGRAFRQVTLSDSTQKTILYGEYVEYRQLQKEALAVGRPLFSRLINEDSLHLSADTLYHRDLDSVNNFLSAYHHVKIYRKDLQAVCDSATLNTKDSVMQLYDTPVLWSGAMQATSRLISIEIGKNSVKGFSLTGQAFLAQEVDSLHNNKYQQLTGKTIVGDIVSDTIRKVVVNGNAEMLYFPKNEKQLIGLNHTVCSEIDMWFKEGEVHRITLKPATTGQVDPMRDVTEEKAILKGFKWRQELRPLSKQSLRTR